MKSRLKLAVLALLVIVMLCLIIYRVLPHRRVAAASPTGMIPGAATAQFA